MKALFSLLLILIVNSFYGQPATTDPYFVETRDTVSAFGPICITRNLLEDTKGNIWLASFQGIMKYDGKVFTNYTLKENLIHFHVFSVTEDKIGNIWFGTVRGGAYKYNGKTFTLFTTNDGLVDNFVGPIMEDKSGNIWFGTDGGISVLDTSASFRTNAKLAFTTLSGLPLTSKKGFTNYTTDNGLCGNRVNSIIQDKTGKIWIGTRTGVSCYDNKSFTNFTMKGVSFTNVQCIKEDKYGKIWIGGYDGLYCYDPSTTGESSLVKMMPNSIGYIFEDRAGTLWLTVVGEKGDTLYKYDKKTLSKIIEKNEKGDNQIFELTEDKKGNIWFSTMKGPCRYDGKTFVYFTKQAFQHN